MDAFAILTAGLAVGVRHNQTGLLASSSPKARAADELNCFSKLPQQSHPGAKKRQRYSNISERAGIVHGCAAVLYGWLLSKVASRWGKRHGSPS
jgi:hypothetical protein